MKKIQTSVSTGDTFTGIDGITYKVGMIRTFNGKREISLHVSINKVSGYTKQVTTRELNKLIGSTN